jgi:hypothetical protein
MTLEQWRCGGRSHNHFLGCDFVGSWPEEVLSRPTATDNRSELASMVLLTMTTAVVEALHKSPPAIAKDDVESSSEAAQAAPSDGEPSLANPAVGNPISHGQIVDLWKRLQGDSEPAPSLEMLLRGSRVYVPPPPPKPEKVRTICLVTIESFN